MKRISLVLMCLLVAFSATAQDVPDAGNDWSKPFFARIDVTFSSTDYHARWDISRCSCGDLYIVAEETMPDEILKGEQLLLESRVLLVRGYETYTGLLPALMDSPVLMMQLLFVLLQKAESSGPSALISAINPALSEDNDPIMLDSGIAYGAFPAPWTLNGSVSPATQGGIRFDLHFNFDLPGAGQQWIELSGSLDYQEKPFPIDDSLVLDGWSAAWLELETENHQDLTPGITLGKFKESL